MKTRRVTITNITYITPIQMEGPIVTPMTLPENTIKELVSKGYNVLQDVNGVRVKLTSFNFNNPEGSIKTQTVTPAQTKVNTTSEKRFEKQSPIVATEPIPTPKPIEAPKNTPTEYNFGNEVEAVDTSISSGEETVGRLFTGRSIPDVSPNVEAISEVNLAQEGIVEAGNINTSEDTTTNNSGDARNNYSNRLQNKRKHKK